MESKAKKKMDQEILSSAEKSTYKTKEENQNAKRFVDVGHWCSIITFVVGQFHFILNVWILGFSWTALHLIDHILELE